MVQVKGKGQSGDCAKSPVLRSFMDTFYRSDELNIYCGDCVKVMSEMPSELIDLTVTSPPYGNLRNYNGYSFDFVAVAQELYRLTKQGGVVVWIIGDRVVDGSETGISFQQALFFKEVGFKLHDTMIYEKLNGMPLNHNRYEQKSEYMFVLVKGSLTVFNGLREPCVGAGKVNTGGARVGIASRQERDANFGGWGYGKPIKQDKLRSNVWKYYTGNGHSTTDRGVFSSHPAVFPEALAQDHILSWSREGDAVFDPMCGSGTTLKMALLNHRKAIGVDISEEYCALSAVRCLRALSEKSKGVK